MVTTRRVLTWSAPSAEIASSKITSCAQMCVVMYSTWNYLQSIHRAFVRDSFAHRFRIIVARRPTFVVTRVALKAIFLAH
jgi:hypothetical protein